MTRRSATITTRSTARASAWPLLPLLAVVALGACSAGSDDQPPAASSTLPAATEPAADPTGVETAPPPASFAPGEQCAATQLTVAFGSVPAGNSSQSDAAQYDVPLVFTNASDVECTLTGYPGTMLRSSDGAGYDLPRSTRVPTDRVVVSPGGTARATLTYLGAQPSDNGVFVPATVVVTPPDQFDQIVLTWPFGAVLDQSGATRPGTYISAISGAP